MNTICPIKNCTGCSACMNKCPRSAITMQEDSNGFFYPNINQELCIDCGLCVKVCPVNNEVPRLYPKSCYAAHAKKEEARIACASGGAATMISKFFLENKGVVYGCCGVDITDVHHIRIDKIDELNLLRGSKYVQSKINYSYKEVHKDLLSKRLVLFIGTPCQIAGLLGFLLYKDYPNLYTIDLVCHGVPSQKMLNDNISLYQKSSLILDLQFRKKLVMKNSNIKSENPTLSYKIKFGWFYKCQDGKDVEFSRDSKDDYYMSGFLKCLFFRNNCYDCKYANIARISDFTLSDFWGLGRDAKMEIGKGVSGILVNTSKAQLLLNEIKDLSFVQRDIVELIKGNGQLQRPSFRHNNYFKFRELYPKIGFAKAVDICLRKDYVKDKLISIFNQVKQCF